MSYRTSKLISRATLLLATSTIYLLFQLIYYAFHKQFSVVGTILLVILIALDVVLYMLVRDCYTLYLGNVKYGILLGLIVSMIGFYKNN